MGPDPVVDSRADDDDPESIEQEPCLSFKERLNTIGVPPVSVVSKLN